MSVAFRMARNALLVAMGCFWLLQSPIGNVPDTSECYITKLVVLGRSIHTDDGMVS